MQRRWNAKLTDSAPKQEPTVGFIVLKSSTVLLQRLLNLRLKRATIGNQHFSQMQLVRSPEGIPTSKRDIHLNSETTHIQNEDRRLPTRTYNFNDSPWGR
jgi:hypothetical protein